MNLARANAWLRAPAFALSGGYLLLYLVLVALRVGFPYDLEWEEGAMVDQAVRIRQGLPLYVEPSIEFVSQLYAPLYFYLGAGVAAFVGDGFLPLRLVSIVSSFACIGFVAALARHETGSRSAGLLAVGLFLSTYAIAAAWLDVARVDSLFLALALGSVHAMRTRDSIAGAVLAAFLLWGAFLTKQQGALLAAPFGLYLLLARGPRPALALLAPFAALALASVFALDAATNGWASYYMFEMPSGHAIFGPMILGYWWVDLLKPLPIACAVCVALILVAFRGAAREPGPWLSRFDDGLFWLFFLGAFVAISWGSRMHHGGATNVVLPAYAAMGVAWAVAITRFAASADARRACFLWTACVVQLLSMAYDPRPLVPGEDHRRAGDQLVAGLAAIDGDVLATWHGWVPSYAGKKIYAHRSALNDVLRSHPGPVNDALREALVTAIERGDFAAVVVNHPLFLRDFVREALARRYENEGPMLDDGLTVGGLLGFPSNPRLYVRRTDGDVPEMSR